jgi:hypothetical protein
MKIILLGHPAFFGSHSMDRFAAMIVDGMRARGHQADLWTPAAVMWRLPARGGLRKWLGYIDQYILFPMLALWRLRKDLPFDASPTLLAAQDVERSQ